MNIGLVIVNYNDSDNVIKLIKNIKSFKSVKMIVGVDNNSFTSELNKIKKLKIKNVKVIENDNNYGYAYALNVGSKYINENLNDAFIVLSNTDVEIPSEKVLISMAKKINDDIKCVMPKVKEESNYKYGWKLTSSSKDLINYPEEYFKNNNVVDVIYGCCFMIEGKTLKDINYFDDKTFLYYEEYILARKLEKINKKSVVDTEVFVSHIHNAVIGSNINKLRKYKIYKKSQLYYEKKYNRANFIEMFFFRLFYIINLIPYEIKNILKRL